MPRPSLVPLDPSLNPLSYWYQALQEEHGLCLVTPNRDLMRRKLYMARAKEKDPEIDSLKLVFSPFDETHLWIVRTDALPAAR